MAFLYISVHELYYVFLGMLLLVMSLITVVLFYAFTKFRGMMQRENWSAVIDQTIVGAIISDKKESASISNNAAVMRKPGFRELFLEKLVAAERKFSGSAGEAVKELFYLHGLQKEAYGKLDQKKYHLIAGGIQELSAMKVTEALPKIESFLNHHAAEVYQEAQYAVLIFRGFEGLGFMNTVSHKISDWQQMRLLLSVTEMPQDSNHDIKKWLSSSNDSVVIFMLRLLRKFQMLYYYPQVWNLLSHHNDEVKLHAVQTLGFLENADTIPALMEVFPMQTHAVQQEIICAIEASRDQRTIHFLQSQLLNHTFTGIKIRAAEALFILGHEDYLRETALDSQSTEELKQIIKHALQEKIC